MADVSERADPKRARRRTFLIDRKFQLKYTFIIVLVGVVVSGLLGFFIYRLNSENRELLQLDMVGKETMAQVEMIDSYTMYYLVGFVVVMALALLIWGIFITHRVAGPIFIISRYLGQIRDGTVPQTRPLRRNDELQEFFETFAGMVASLKHRNLEEADLLSAQAKQIREKGGEGLAAVAKAIEGLAAEKKSWGKP